MSYAVKELFLTLQGEGAQTGRRAVFLRFAGCNLWSGREADRAGAVCRFCDTDFVGMDGPGGGRYADPEAMADAVAHVWGAAGSHRLVVCTGGEPLLQLDEALIAALHARDFAIAVETNGTIVAPPGIDWLCVSPKAGSTTVQRRGDEMKLVFPQPGLMPDAVQDWDFAHFFVQPMDGPDRAANVRSAIAWCLANPKWRLSLQTHKLTGIP
jgi:7-carboxy-7-deazaguanine synthase (Cx14CxxC type)